MKIAVAGGHSKKAPGMSSYLDEYTEDRKVAKALIKELKARGHTVTDCSNEKATQSAELKEECRLANKSGASLFIAVHFNAASKTSGTRGSEVWYHTNSTKGKNYAGKVVPKLAKALGLKNRGIKSSKSLYVLNNTTMTAILIEICFGDAKGDAQAYKETGVAKIADAIADAIGGGSSSSFKSYKVKITASVLNVRKGAGTNYAVSTTVKKNEVYTIVAEKKNGSTSWGQLKSGAGWISLAYTKKV